MCQQHLVYYACHWDHGCPNGRTVWSTHCDSSGRDNVQGDPYKGCQGVTVGEIKTLDYPCAEHRGLQDPQVAAQDVRRDGSSMWRNAPRSGAGVRPNGQHTSVVDYGLRSAWEQNPSLYEGNPYMTDVEWRSYSKDVFNRNVDSAGPPYWEDPEPWGDQREGGGLRNRDRRR